LKTEHYGARMQLMREAWTDERLDDLNAKVDRGFARLEQRFDQMERRFDKVDERFERVDEKFERVDEKFERVDEKFERLYRLLLTLGTAAVVALIGVVATPV
jgi:archaellum component FlaC